VKVVLLNSNTHLPERIENEAAWPPLGLLYIGTVLQTHGHEIKLIDNARMQLPVEKVVERVVKEEPEVVGLSALTHTFRQSVKLAQAIKEKNPDIKIVYGNYHPTFEYERLLRSYHCADYVILGEGEYTFLDLVETLEKERDIREVKGIAFRYNGGVVRTSPRPLIQELDELPFPDRHLLEQEYHSELVGVLGSGCKFTTILSSRGCPYGCKYCACSAFTARKVRFRSPENVVDEMEMLWSEGYEEIGFVDDNLLLNPKRVEKICELLKSRKIKLKMWAEGRADQASLETLKKFSKVGCKTIYFGLESGTQKVLDYYGKNITPELSRKAVSNSKKAGIENVIGSFIVGAPIETKEDVQQTFDFAFSLKGMDFPQMNVLILAPGIELWDNAIKKGYMDGEQHWEAPVPAVNIYPSYLKERELIEMIDEFYKKFIKRASYLAYQLWKTLKSEYRMKIVLANLRARTSFRKTIQHLWGYQ